MSESRVWVFSGEGSQFPSAVFSNRAAAEAWIGLHALTGVLTAYPLDEGAYDWAVRQGLFTPKKTITPQFVGRFTSASQEHYHYDESKHSGE